VGKEQLSSRKTHLQHGLESALELSLIRCAAHGGVKVRPAIVIPCALQQTHAHAFSSINERICRYEDLEKMTHGIPISHDPSLESTIGRYRAVFDHASHMSPHH